MVTAGIRAHACGEGGAVARGNVELLEVSDRVEHVVCAFPEICKKYLTRDIENCLKSENSISGICPNVFSSSVWGR
jgi:hypothetical protein